MEAPSSTSQHCPKNPAVLKFFLEKARKTTKKKPRIVDPCRASKIPGKEGKNAQKNKEILAGTKNTQRTRPY